MNKKVSTIIIVVVFAVGFIVGNGVYSLYNADALSYLSQDSSQCNNCHVMNEVYADYIKMWGVQIATCPTHLLESGWQKHRQA